MDNKHVLARRGFLRLISALPAALVVWRSTPVQAAPLTDITRSTYGPWQPSPHPSGREEAFLNLKAEIQRMNARLARQVQEQIWANPPRPLP